jgi:hypothetical protein
MTLRSPLLRLLAITLFASLCVAFGAHTTLPSSGYILDAKIWVASGRIADTFLPLGYPLFIAPIFGLAGLPGIIGLQVTLQCAIAAICFLLLRELGVSSTWSAFGSLPVALDPDLLLSVVKIWDVPLSTFFLLLLVLVCLRLHHRTVSSSPWLVGSIGLVFGAGLFCRPNYAFLLPVIFLSFYRRGKTRSLRLACGYFTASIAIACATFALLGVVSHGSPFSPRNGPYNLYAGHNPRSI